MMTAVRTASARMAHTRRAARRRDRADIRADIDRVPHHEQDDADEDRAAVLLPITPAKPLPVTTRCDAQHSCTAMRRGIRYRAVQSCPKTNWRRSANKWRCRRVVVRGARNQTGTQYPQEPNEVSLGRRRFSRFVRIQGVQLRFFDDLREIIARFSEQRPKMDESLASPHFARLRP